MLPETLKMRRTNRGSWGWSVFFKTFEWTYYISVYRIHTPTFGGQLRINRIRPGIPRRTELLWIEADRGAQIATRYKTTHSTLGTLTYGLPVPWDMASFFHLARGVRRDLSAMPMIDWLKENGPTVVQEILEW